MKAIFTHSSGNVFADLGFPQNEALSYRLRSELMTELRRQIKDRGVTQQQAAEMLNVTQPRISDLVRGQIDKFSLDGLVDMIGLAGLDITVTMGTAEVCAPVIQELDLGTSFGFSDVVWTQPLREIGPNLALTLAPADMNLSQAA